MCSGFSNAIWFFYFQASQYLAEYLLHNPDVIKDRWVIQYFSHKQIRSASSEKNVTVSITYFVESEIM